jgi:hypothetical protein
MDFTNNNGLNNLDSDKITFNDSVSIWNKIISEVPFDNDGINGPFIIDQPNIEYLPKILCEGVYDGVINFHVSPMFILLNMVSAMNCAARGYFHVENGQYPQIANIFLISCAKPGYGKSHITDNYKHPAIDYEYNYNESIKHIIERERVERDALNERMKKMKKKAPNPDDSIKYEKYIKELISTQSKIDQMNTKELVIFADNTSAAGLIRLLASQNERIAIMEPEFGILKKLINAKSSSDLSESLIRAFNGDSIKSDLVTQDPINLENPTVAIGVSTQLYILKNFFMNEMINKTGMGGRILIHIADDRNIGFRQYNELKPKKIVYEMYCKKITKVLDRVHKSGKKYETLYFDDEAKTLFKKLRSDIEGQLQKGRCMHKIQEWGAKSCMHLTSMAAFVHLFEDTDSNVISIKTFRAALKIVDWLALNFISFYEYMNPSNAKQIALSICDKLIEKSATSFTEREVQRFFDGIAIDLIRQALSLLEMHGAIYQKPTYRNGPGRPSKLYNVNPLIIGSVKNLL